MSMRMWLILVLVAVPGKGIQGQGLGPQEDRAQICADSRVAVQDTSLSEEERSKLMWGLHFCGDLTGELLAEELRGMGAMSDLRAMNRMLNSMMGRRDPRILQAALDLMSDHEATIEGRVAALRLFVEYHDYGSATSFGGYGLPWEPRPGARLCDISAHTHGSWTDLRPLPEDWRSMVRDRVTILENADATPDPVRFAAHCTLQWMKLDPPPG
jgi:hypothetical protein